jgi:hypothetical protein
MALQKTTTTNIGLEAPQAYHRVETLYVTTKNKMDFFIRSYASKNQQNWFAEKQYESEYDMNGENPIRQAYIFLKQQPEWSAAIDC